MSLKPGEIEEFKSKQEVVCPYVISGELKLMIPEVIIIIPKIYVLFIKIENTTYFVMVEGLDVCAFL